MKVKENRPPLLPRRRWTRHPTDWTQSDTTDKKKPERFPDEMFSSDPFPLVPLEGPSTILWSRHHGLRTLFPWWPYLDWRVSV